MVPIQHKSVNGGCKEVDWCLICNSKVQLKPNHDTKTEKLSESLKVIFLFKKILQVPDSVLETNLKQQGDPHNWISLCKECDNLTNEAFEAHSKIQKLEKTKWDVRDILTSKIKSTSDKLPKIVAQQFDIKKTQLFNRTRTYVKQCSYEMSSDEKRASDRNGDDVATRIVKNQLKGLQDIKKKTYGENTEDKIIIRVKIEPPEECVTDKHCDVNETGADENERPISSPIREKKIPMRKGRSTAKATSEKSSNVSKQLNDRSKLKKDGKWKCHFCDEEFDQRVERKKHEKENHVSPTGNFTCEICGKERSTLAKLLHHKRRVHKVKPDGTQISATLKSKGPKKPDQVCNQCGKSYACLVNHVRLVHDKRYAIQCEICEKGFWSKTAYKTHFLRKHKEDPKAKQMIEEGATIIKCTVLGCKAYFLEKGLVEKHFKRVHGNGDTSRFTCATCGKRFLYSYDLKEHENVHLLNGEKTLPCEFCGNSFTKLKNLNDHKRRFHRNENK